MRTLREGTICCPVKRCKKELLHFQTMYGFRIIIGGFIMAKCPKHGVTYKVKTTPK